MNAHKLLACCRLHHVLTACVPMIVAGWLHPVCLLCAGNVVELILSIAALQAGLYDVVSTSLLGSILSNLLLVLGMSFFVGGLK